jgi:catechol 2,3-dioxygenase-like lactoylglutathione lyase family enzyme
MRIHVTSVLVDDQDKALRFYTEALGFVKKTEIPVGEHRWLTVVSPEDPDGTELLLEPDGHPAAKPDPGCSGRRANLNRSLTSGSPRAPVASPR